MLTLAGITGPSRHDLLARMAEPHRRYHGIGHLETLWSRHRRHAAAAGFDTPQAHRLIACAIAYHDAVYVAGAADNEIRSTALWRSAAPSLPAADIDWVAETILCTANHLAPYENADPLRLWMLDLDLTPLGEPRALFLANMEALLDEWTGTDRAEAARRQLRFLRNAAAAPRIFRTPILHDTYEATARDNLKAVLPAEGG